MPSLSAFTDFTNSTPPVYLTEPERFVNDAIEHMPIIGRLMFGRTMGEMLQGGATIRDPIKLDVTGTAEVYSPAEEISYQLRQSQVLGEIRWRFIRDHKAVTEKELLLNAPPGSPSRLYKSVDASKEQDVWTSIFNFLERNILFASPNDVSQADVEAAAGEFPYPLYALINENTNRQPLGWAGTTVQNIDRSVQTNYQNILNQYDYNDPDDTDADEDGLLDAFEDTHLDLQFRAPRMPGVSVPGNAFQDSGQPDANRMFIMTSNGGVRFYKRRLRNNNDVLAGFHRQSNDPAYIAPEYAGTPVEQSSFAGSATLYSNDGTVTGTGVTELNANDPGFRYYFVNGNFLRPVFHTQKFFQREPMRKLEKQPDTAVQVFDIWMNFFLSSARRQGLVAPGA